MSDSSRVLLAAEVKRGSIKWEENPVEGMRQYQQTWMAASRAAAVCSRGREGVPCSGR